MQKLVIKKFGPIEECEVIVKDFLVFTGPQASGKSTVAKSIFFFNYIKDIFFQYIMKSYQKKQLFQVHSLEKALINEIRNAFIQAFGEETGQDESVLNYTYDNESIIKILFKKSEKDGLLTEPVIDKKISEKIIGLAASINSNGLGNSEDIKHFIYSEMFDNDMEILYIPAGRSLLTLLSNQIGYMYSMLDDRQKSSMDFCTQNYLERVLQIKSYFDRSPAQLLNRQLKTDSNSHDEDTMNLVIQKMVEILKGEYNNSDGEEMLKISDKVCVKLNYASSGQQEAVWITNMLFYYMLGDKKTYFIIEEPESHLFPEAQKAITELISIAKNDSNKVLITTHSPYILGSINNLLYANKVAGSIGTDKVEDIVPARMWLSYEVLGAYYLESGKINNTLDTEYQDIDHEVIDGVSTVINEVYEKLAGLGLEDGK